MATSDSVRAMLAMSDKKQQDLGAELGMSKQAFSNKIRLNRWNARDLIKAAEFCGWKLELVSPDGQTIEIKENEEAPDA